MGSERFLTLPETAEILNVTVSQTYALVRSGELKGIQIGGRNQWRVERVMLEDFIQEAYKRTAAGLKDLPAEPPAPDQWLPRDGFRSRRQGGEERAADQRRSHRHPHSRPETIAAE